MSSVFSEHATSVGKLFSYLVPPRCRYRNQMISVYFSIMLLVDVYAKDLSLIDVTTLSSKLQTIPNEQIDKQDLTNIPSTLQNTELYKSQRNSILSNVIHHLPPYIPGSAEKHKNRKIRRISKKLLRKNSKRRKRHYNSGRRNHETLARRSCQTKSVYNYKETATDMFGDEVQVSPFIHIGNLSIVQYFYESFCDQEKCECSGIDNKNFGSSCETDYIFTYARVVKNGEIGWTHIKVRSGCSCKIHRMNVAGPVNIVDLI